jgi:serine/threonine-protein kinase
MTDWSANQIIQGRYRLESVLGKGGMGSVWRAEHLQLKSIVAVKRLDESIASNPEALARFEREARASAALRSPNVVQVFDYGVDDGVAFIAMELLQGESLADRIRRLGRLSPADTLWIFTDVLRAIGKAHAAGIVHRDLKPDNIFICGDDPEFAKVLDFGVAKLTGTEAHGASQTQTGMVIGTPYYMSPEQAQGKVIDARSDLWSMGVIAYECMTGRLPFFGESFAEILIAICMGQAEPPSHVAPVPAGFNEWFACATQREREARFASAKDMASALAALSTGSPAMVSGYNTGVEGALARAPGTVQVSSQLSTEQRSATAKSVATAGDPPSKKRPLGVIAGVALALVVSVTALILGFRSSGKPGFSTAASATAPANLGLSPAVTATPSPNPVVVAVPSASTQAPPEPIVTTAVSAEKPNTVGRPPAQSAVSSRSRRGGGNGAPPSTATDASPSSGSGRESIRAISRTLD